MFSKRSDQSRIPDPGFGEKVGGKAKRVINHDGSFNVSRKHGENSFRVVYQFLVEIDYLTFFFIIFLSYVIISLLFALSYFYIGPEHLIGVKSDTAMGSFLDCFYFSTQTFTTVGYGAIAPRGFLASTVASLEAFTGLIFFAIATSLMYARFSKPRSLLRYSKNALIAPYLDGKAHMFRLANARPNVLMDLKARMIMVMRQSNENTADRRFYSMKLELDNVTFLPLSWTLVHKLDESSPLFGITENELNELNAEVMVLITAFDDTFHQTVHSRYSYVAEEFVWDAKFKKAFTTNKNGDVVLDLEAIDSFELIEKS